MKERLDKIEAKLQRLVEGTTDRIFRSQGIYKQLIHRLIAVLEDNLQTDDQGITTAPSNFSLIINQKFASDDLAGSALVKFVAQKLGEVASENGISFESEPTITVYSDGAIPEGEFVIHALQPIEQEELPDTTEGVFIKEENQHSVLANKPFLIPDDNKIINLDRNVVNIGRELDNQLVIDDMRVSRKHAQLRATEGRYYLFDLKSSGGTFVNGEQIKQVVLEAGDVISFAGVSMVYGEDAIPHPSETEEYKVASNSPSDSAHNGLGSAN